MFGEKSFIAPTAYKRRRRMSSRPVSGCTRRHRFWARRTRQRLAMEIVSCYAPTKPGQSPPTPIFTLFSKLQGASTTMSSLCRT
ncbi:unnamed protein product [Strongylus vulgaris]|uniref:Uncharacterized protein n=1 Tax=Strongylus vulgaris TaxID=40348 RepID=A0A3P7LL92_STRVU|nr:unnamed protein product [Strongylus vulgaris]